MYVVKVVSSKEEGHGIKHKWQLYCLGFTALFKGYSFADLNKWARFCLFLYQVPVFRILCLIQDILVHKWTWSSMFIGWDLFFYVAYKWISMKILCSLCYDKEKNIFTFLIRKQLEGIGLVRSYLDLHWHIVKKMTVIKGLQVGFLNR